jgi:hypothetical protein
MAHSACDTFLKESAVVQITIAAGVVTAVVFPADVCQDTA